MRARWTLQEGQDGRLCSRLMLGQQLLVRVGGGRHFRVPVHAETAPLTERPFGTIEMNVRTTNLTTQAVTRPC
eukprot:712825-Pyramimonas_sp.AAC.2